MTGTTGLQIQSTGISFEILEFIKNQNGAPLKAIVEDQGKPTSTVHDHLKTLVDLGYLRHAGSEYHLTTKFLEYGGFARMQSRIFQEGESEIQQLAIETGEHANLMIEENGYGVFLLKEKGNDAVKLDTFEGMRVHLHTTALGKSMLAFMAADRADRILDERGLPKVTENTIGDEETLRRELDEIRERGYATDDEERIEGIRCVAAPVTTTNGRVVGAVSISAPKSRMQGEFFNETLPEKVRRTANVIEVNMRHA